MTDAPPSRPALRSPAATGSQTLAGERNRPLKSRVLFCKLSLAEERNAYAILRSTREDSLKVANNPGLLLAGILALAITACRGSTYQTYGFERANGTFRDALSFSLVADGRSVPVDSAGRLIDRTASPYWIGLYVYPRSQINVALTGVRLTSLTSGRSIALPMSELRPLDDSTSTLFSGTREMVLPHEDYAVTVHVNVEERGRTSRDSARAIIS